jgi:hypothetical protein
MTLEAVERIGAKIAKGMPEEHACLLLGYSYAAFMKAKERKPQFVEAQKKAQAIFLDGALDTIQIGAPGWQGLAWILERRHKPLFDRTRESVEVHSTQAFTLSPDQFGELGAFARQLYGGKPAPKPTETPRP